MNPSSNIPSLSTVSSPVCNFHQACLLNDIDTVKEMFTHTLVMQWRRIYRDQWHRLLRGDCVDVVNFLLPYLRRTLLNHRCLYKVQSAHMLKLLRPSRNQLRNALCYFLTGNKPWDYHFKFLIHNNAAVPKCLGPCYPILNKIRSDYSTLGGFRNKLIESFPEQQETEYKTELTPFFFWPLLHSAELWFRGYRPIKEDISWIPQFLSWHLIELLVCISVKQYLPLSICDLLNEYLFVRCKTLESIVDHIFHLLS